MTALSTLPPGIRTFLDEYVVRSRRHALARAVGTALALFLIWMLLWCAVDRFAHLPAAVRLAALILGALVALARIGPPLLVLRRRPDWVSAAAEVEQHNPQFAQRLLTVTSRVLGAADYRGSDEILQRLVREVDQQVAAGRARRLVPLRGAMGPWALCVLIAVLIVALLRAPSLRFGDLAHRFLEPTADIPPVTTTQLDISPGDRDVLQSQPLSIDVLASRLGDSPVTLFLSDDGGHDWSRVVMTPAGANHFAFTLAAIDRDLRYYVAAGDAQSREYLIRVLRRPSVARFWIHYDYPPYTRLPPATVTNTDGHIEAPVGTRVTLTVSATEPLHAALLTIGDEKILMDATADPSSRQAQLILRAQARYGLDLISTRNVAGSGPAAMIRVVPDLPPQVRLAHGGDSLRLNPREVVPLSYEALDDYGLESLAVKAQVNALPPMRVPLRLWGDPRRQQEVFRFDLARLPIGIGDLVTLTVIASDTAGHEAESRPLHVLISPRSIDLDAYERIGELQNATQLAQSLTAEFQDALSAHDEMNGKDRHSPPFVAASSRGDRALSAAAQTATLLRQSLLRAITHSPSAALCTALAGWVDAAEVETGAAEEAFRQSGAPTGMGDSGGEELRRALEQGRQLQSQLMTVRDGERAAALLADRQNLLVAEKKPAGPGEPAVRQMHQTIDRMRQDFDAEVTQLGLNPSAGDLDNQLRAKIAAEEALVNAAKPIDFVSAARQWGQSMHEDPQRRLGLEGRLSAAAEAEAIRRDADLLRARDLELASRAASALGSWARTSGRPVKPGTFDAFAADLEALRRARDLRLDGREHSGQEVQAAHAGMHRALAEMAQWTGEPGALAAAATRATTLAAGGAERVREAEDLAMQASAAAAGRDYQRADALDEALRRRLETKPRREGAPPASSDQADTQRAAPAERVERHHEMVQREMATARNLDTLDQEQREVSQQTVGAPAADELAGRQKEVAERIAQVERQRQPDVTPDEDWPNARDRATAEVLGAEERLAALPQALAAAQAAAAARRDAAQRAADARRQADSAPPDQRSASRRAADQAAQNARDVPDRLTQAVAAVAPAVAEALAQKLAPFAPETETARTLLEGQLASALRSLQSALGGDDGGAVDRAAGEARQAIEACQRELSVAQEALVRRDPLMAARLFARAAAQSLTLRPPDVGRARQHQASVSAALSRAWDQSIHRAASERLATVPSMAAVLGPPRPRTDPGPNAATPAGNSAAAREWSRLRPQDDADINAPMHESDPPGYEESLKLYFEALQKAQEQK